MGSPPLPRGMDETSLFRTANRLHSVAIHLLRWARSVDPQTSLSPERLSVLSVLAFAGPKTVSELAEMELVSLPAISRILGALEDDGLLIRERLAEDRRRVQARITRRGRTLMDGARARRVERIAERLSVLDREELGRIAAAIDLLERLEVATNRRTDPA